VIHIYWSEIDKRVLFIRQEDDTMNGTTALVIIVVIFAVVALVAIWRYRRRIGIDIQAGPAKLGVQGESDPAPDKTPTVSQPVTPAGAPSSAKPGVNIQDAKSGGSIVADDKTGQGVNIGRVETKDDILASSETPPAPKV
jgi:hypothetical protein